MAENMIKTWRARRRLKVAANTFREPGELFPEAHAVRIIESWEHQGRVRRAEVPESEFRAAVEQYIADPAQRQRIYDRTGLTPGQVTRGNHHLAGPAVPTKKVAVVPKDKPASKRVTGPVKKPAKVPATKRVPKVTPPIKRVRAPKPPEKLIERSSADSPDIPMRSLLDDEETP